MERHGPRNVVAMVLLLAYANFQDRLLLTLDLPLEEGGPLPPLAVHFVQAPLDSDPPVPPRRSPSEDARPVARRSGEEALWAPFDFSQLQKSMDGQRARDPRIPVPTWDDVRKLLPEAAANRPPLRIRWSLVCLGYQPELANGWSACTRAFGQEAHQDRVFEESLFWVVTRSLNCFY
jgi:hypothetical protein